MPIHRQMLARRIARMDAIAAPEIKFVNQGVRTGLGAQLAPYMCAIDVSSPSVAHRQHSNPDGLGALAEDLLSKRVMISPIVVTWRYEILDDAAFLDWLAAREILLSEERMSGDAELRGVRYGGTYRLSDDVDAVSSIYKTIWGFRSEPALRAMLRLCHDEAAEATIVQFELIKFVKGLREFIAIAGEGKFSHEMMVAAAMAQA